MYTQHNSYLYVPNQHVISLILSLPWYSTKISMYCITQPPSRRSLFFTEICMLQNLAACILDFAWSIRSAIFPVNPQSAQTDLILLLKFSKLFWKWQGLANMANLWNRFEKNVATFDEPWAGECRLTFKYQPVVHFTIQLDCTILEKIFVQTNRVIKYVEVWYRQRPYLNPSRMKYFFLFERVD